MVERLGKKVLLHRGVHAHLFRYYCGHHLAAKGIEPMDLELSGLCIDSINADLHPASGQSSERNLGLMP